MIELQQWRILVMKIYEGQKRTETHKQINQMDRYQIFGNSNILCDAVHVALIKVQIGGEPRRFGYVPVVP